MQPQEMTLRLGRRELAVAALATATMLLAGCDSGKNGTEDNKDLDAPLTALGEAIDELSGSVGRFSNEDWKEVVPDVETRAADVSNAFDYLKSILGNQ